LNPPPIFHGQSDYIITDPVVAWTAQACFNDLATPLEKREVAIPALLIEGPPGSGKSYLAKFLARAMKARLSYFCFFPGANKSDLLYDKSKDGTTHDGILTSAVRLAEKEPVVLLLDELDKADVSVDSFLLGFIQEGRLTVPSVGLDVRVPPSNLLVVLTQNDQRVASGPLLRRCRHASFGWPEPHIEMEILKRRAPQVPTPLGELLISKAKQWRLRPDIIKPPSINEIITCALDLLLFKSSGASARDIGLFALNGLLKHPRDLQTCEVNPAFLGAAILEASAA
jgi:MoxR-like ATPase